jgi:hypothetical protein
MLGSSRVAAQLVASQEGLSSVSKSLVRVHDGRTVAQRLDAGFPPRRPGFAYRQHMGFVVDKAALVQVFSEYFGFPCQSFHRFLHYHNHPGLPPLCKFKNFLILDYMMSNTGFIWLRIGTSGGLLLTW